MGPERYRRTDMSHGNSAGARHRPGPCYQDGQGKAAYQIYHCLLKLKVFLTGRIQSGPSHPHTNLHIAYKYFTNIYHYKTCVHTSRDLTSGPLFNFDPTAYFMHILFRLTNITFQTQQSGCLLQTKSILTRNKYNLDIY